MNKDLGVWTSQDCALVLIDYQKEIFATIRSETSAALASSMSASSQGPPGVQHAHRAVHRGRRGAYQTGHPAGDLAELPGLQVIDRTTMNAFEDGAFREAVKKTGRKRLIFGGLHTEICLTFATVHALKDGYEAMFVTDAVGGRSQTAHRTAIERLSHAGAVPNTALAVLCELFRDWTSPLAGKAREVIAWYFAEIPKLTADVGV